MTRKLAVAVVFLGAALPFCHLRAAETRGSISGMVKGRSGAAVTGAVVTAKNNALGLTVSVSSQENGSYRVPNLPAGTYAVQSVGDGLQSAIASVALAGGGTAMQDMLLDTRADPRKTASTADYATTMPEGQGKTIILGMCTDCHTSGLQEIVYSRKDRQAWVATVAKMRDHPYGYFRSLIMTDAQVEVVINYLAEHYGPHQPPFDAAKLSKRLLKGPAAKAVVTEFKLPAHAGAHDVAVDSRGIAWVCERYKGVLGRFDPVTLQYERIPLPGSNRRPNALEVDPQDRIWMSDEGNSRLTRYDPKTKTFEDFPLTGVLKDPDESSQWNTIRVAADGTVWATHSGGNRVFHLNPQTKKATMYEVPFGVVAKRNANPYGMAIAGDGVWFTEGKGGKVGKIDMKSGKIAEYDVPGKPVRLRRMEADGGGNIWLGTYSENFLTMVDARTGRMTQYPPPTGFSGPYSVDVDRGRNLVWFNQMMADQIARFDPRSKQFVEFPMPTKYSSVRRIEVDPSRPNRVWYTGYFTDTVGFLDTGE